MGLVLVVDDDAASRFLCREALEQAGFSVIEADDGSTALPLFHEHQPDVVILDVLMRQMNGFDACAMIRKSPAGQHVPILMMTALGDLESIDRAFEHGATDFQPKGLNHGLLAYRVRYLLRAKQVADALRASEERLANAQRIARLGHWEWDSESDRTYYSGSLKAILGAEPQSDHTYLGILGHVHAEDRDTVKSCIEGAVASESPFRLQHRVVCADGSERVVYHEGEVVNEGARPRVVCADGSERVIHHEGEVVNEGTRLRVVGTVQDVTERIETEQRLDHLTYYDALTNLPNRSFVRQHLQRTLAAGVPEDMQLSLIVINIDRFKAINDTLGHAAGDELLIALGQRLSRYVRWRDRSSSGGAVRRGDTIARLGGDEFAVVVTQPRESSSDMVERITRAASGTFVLGDKEVRVTAGVGISRHPKDGDSADSLLLNAYSAMHRAKELGRDRRLYYTGSINVRATRRFILENDLRDALAQDQLEVHYQAQVDLAKNRTIGAEALVRWRHPTLGIVPPSEFIPLAEESGLIVPLGAWVLRTACAQTRAWQRAGFPLSVAVNVSARQFNPELVETLRAVLRDTALAPRFLELEITEGVLLEDGAASIAILDTLRGMGLKIALDDFGTGYSSLSYLQRFRMDTLKIDRSFVKDTPLDLNSVTLVRTIIAMAKNLGLSVVAEGVETPDQLAFLKTHECQMAQGYLLGAPLPPAEFEQRLVQRPARRELAG
jgi:diguanylate cyclase (GGDEF)-like protein